MPSPRIRTASSCHGEEAGRTGDAVRVPRSIGLDALAILGSRSGAVLDDPLSASLYWFIPQGASVEWNVPNTRTLEQKAHLAIPPVRRTEGPGFYWRVCPGEGAWVTEPAALRAALLDAFGPALATEEVE
ncbi:hypothetical protein ACPXCP_03800 [Streptomyces sp. DT20]|uniref:hypothetical protein n=1 Tax=unclassified Streptomyces TaxID=2593676 RepID=UPI002E29F98C|nr:hypothetical protein [Streptomyces sp. NBC_00342]